MISSSVAHRRYLWPAATDLANHIIVHWSTLRPSRFCELGAGCGLVGVVASLLGAGEVVLTDYDPGALELIERNVRTNCSEERVCEVRSFQWGHDVSSLTPSPFDLVLGADLLYCSKVVEPLFNSVSQLIGDDGMFILGTSFELGESIESEILRCAAKYRLSCSDIVPLNEKQSKIQYFRPAR